MTAHEQPERTWTPDQVQAALTELGGTGRPPDLDDLVRQAARTPQRPAWTFPERWIPMTVLTRPRAAAPPARRALLYIALAGLILASVAGLVLAAGRLLSSPPGPDHGFPATLLIPELRLADTWDASRIDGLEVPTGMAVGPDGNLYVVNGGRNEILVLSPTGTVVRRIGGTRGVGPGEFDFQRDPDPRYSIGGIAIDRDGDLYVVDLRNDRVQVLSTDGTYLREWGGYGVADGRFMDPIDAAVAPDGTVWVVDDQRDDFQQFAPDGTWIKTVGRHGTGPGELSFTGGIATDPAGNLVNADFENHRVQSWAPDGTFRWSASNAVPGEAGNPKPGDVIADGEGNVIVSDQTGLVLVGEGLQPRRLWSMPDDMPTAEDWLPVAIAPDGTVFVAGPFNSVIWHLTADRVSVDVPAPSTTPAPTAPPPAAATPAPSGTLISSGSPFPVPFTATLPPRWSVYETTRGRVSMRVTRGPDNTPVYVVVSIPLNAYEDPCHTADGPRDPRVGPDVEDMVEALTHLVGYRPTTVTDEVIDGRPARAFDLENAAVDIATCSENPWLRTWTYDGSRGGATNEVPEGDLATGHSHIDVLDVDGRRVIVWLWAAASDAHSDEIQEAQAVVDSIRFQ